MKLKDKATKLPCLILMENKNRYQKLDSSLLAQCLKGKRAAQNQLYLLLLPRLEYIGKRYLFDLSQIEEVLQETFILIFTNLDKFDAGRASFKTWAGRIMINNCLKIKTGKKRINIVPLESLTQEFQLLNDTLENIDTDVLTKWLKSMPLDYFQVFNLYIIDEYSHKDIAVLLNISEDLSRQRLSRARQWIRKQKSKFPQIKKSLFN